MPDEVRLSFLDWLATEDQERQDQYEKYREYYEGDHGTQLTERQRRYLQIKDGQEFNVNLMAVVVDALVERLEVLGFAVTDERTYDGQAQADVLWQWWTANRMDGVQKDLHTAAVRDGDGYVLLEWDEEGDRPLITHELACAGSEGVKVHYASDRRRTPVFASKRWQVRSEDGSSAGYRRRLNLYYPNRIEKYISDQREFEGAWRRYAEEGEGWPLWWTRDGREGGEPLGVPVVHFRNQGRGYNYGRSELVDAIPVQNALNKSVIDTLAAADTAAFRLLYMLGDDPSGLNIAPGVIIYSEKGPSDVSFGSIPPSDLSQLIRLVDECKVTVAQTTRTPVSYFQISGHRPAEGTLKQEEAGLVAKAVDRQVYFGNAWEDVMALARKLHNTFGQGETLDEEASISTQWRDAQSRNERELAETMAIHRDKLGVPLETVWRRVGYAPDEIEEMLESD